MPPWRPLQPRCGRCSGAVGKGAEPSVPENQRLDAATLARAAARSLAVHPLRATLLALRELPVDAVPMNAGRAVCAIRQKRLARFARSASPEALTQSLAQIGTIDPLLIRRILVKEPLQARGLCIGW